MDTNLTLEEMEREAYQRGETERARLLALALDGESSVADEMASELDYERDQRIEAEDAVVRLQDLCLKYLNKIEDAINAMDAATALKEIQQAREEI